LEFDKTHFEVRKFKLAERTTKVFCTSRLIEKISISLFVIVLCLVYSMDETGSEGKQYLRPIEIAYNLCELVDRGTVASLTSLEAILAQLTERGTVVRWKTAVSSVHSFFAHSSLLVYVAN
jgi:hypothetical protein